MSINYDRVMRSASYPYPRAYLYYENAQCKDSTTIKGYSTLTFDEETFSNYGYSRTYTGPCLYLDGGYWEVNYYSDPYEDVMKEGYCIQCNDQVGCSVDGSCQNFMNYMPQSFYQMTQGQQQEVNNNMMTTSTTEENKNEYYKSASRIQVSTIKTLEQANNTYLASSSSSTDATYVIYGAIISFVTIFGVLGILEFARQYRQSKSSTQILINDIVC